METKREGWGLRGLILIGAMTIGTGFAAASRVLAEEHYGGMISVTFHEENQHRTTPKSVYVTKEEGLTRWRNYKQRKPGGDKKPLYVYEIKNKESLPKTASIPKQRNVARAK